MISIDSLKGIKVCVGLLFLIGCDIGQAQDLDRLRKKAVDAKSFCQSNDMSTKLCVLVDMSIHSGKYRMFIWDFEGDSIKGQGLCSHGCSDHGWSADYTKTGPHFSNVPDSHCSSLGKYKIGTRGWSNFGIHVNYRLHGLEMQNNNALKRNIVFHSWDVMPHAEVFPFGSPESWGCPAVSNEFMRFVDEELKVVEGDVLMWIYE